MIQTSLKSLFSWLFVKSVHLQRHLTRSQRAVKGRSSAVRRREWLWKCRGIWVVNPAVNLTTEARTATTLRAGEFPCALLVFYQILHTSKYMQDLNVFFLYIALHWRSTFPNICYIFSKTTWKHLFLSFHNSSEFLYVHICLKAWVSWSNFLFL